MNYVFVHLDELKLSLNMKLLVWPCPIYVPLSLASVATSPMSSLSILLCKKPLGACAAACLCFLIFYEHLGDVVHQLEEIQTAYPSLFMMVFSLTDDTNIKTL